MQMSYQSDVAIVGAGIAGIVAALELLDANKSVTIIERNDRSRFGGLANEAFGGMALIDTPLQKLNGIHDSSELAIQDWKASAEFGDDDIWPLKWAEYYAAHSRSHVYDWLKQKKIYFFPAVQWVERGDSCSDPAAASGTGKHISGNDLSGNSVPRYHIVWGTGSALCQTLISHLEQHPNRSKLQILFEHTVEGFDFLKGEMNGCHGKADGREFCVESPHMILACGGINGNLEKVKSVWDSCYGKAPDNLLNGSHPSADGALHDQVSKLGGNVTHLPWMWNYAAGIANPKQEFEHQGLSLIPPRSALWMDAYGKRIGPKPLITGFDTHELCKQIGHLEHQYSWQVMNWKIAIKEMAISGSDMNPSFRDKKLFRFLKEILFGNKALVKWMLKECPDVVSGASVEELASKMNTLSGFERVDPEQLEQELLSYDAKIKRGQTSFDDEQLQRIGLLREWRGDRVRTCRYQKILDPKAGPLIAIRERLISRKSMGGMQTDLQSRVLNKNGEPIKGLYAVGEAAGFGGGGINGVRSLEGTFLSSCILTSRNAAQSINTGAIE